MTKEYGIRYMKKMLLEWCYNCIKELEDIKRIGGY